jgi:prohibitin 2
MAGRLKDMASKMPKGPGPNAANALSTLIKLGLGAGAIGISGYYSLYNVEAGHRAIIFDRIVGIKKEVIHEGTHFLIPFIQWPVFYDIRTRPRNIMSLTGSKDLQMVNINVRVLSRPHEKKLPDLYEKLGLDFDDRVLPSIVNEVCKQVVAQYNAVQLLTQREQVSKRIRQNLIDRAREFDIVVDDVALTELRFGREFMAAVEAKQVAQQDAERSKFIVEKALEEKRSIIIKAQGEAQSAKLISSAISKNPGFVELRRMDVAKDVATTISRSANKVYLNADSLLLNLLDSKGVQGTVTK